MFLQSGSRLAGIASAWLLIAGLLTGCGESFTATTPTFPSVEEAIKNIGKSAADGINEQLRKVIDPNLTIDKQVEQLQTKAKELYCAADNSALADAIKGIAQAIWTDITRGTPDAQKLDLTKDDCAK